MGERNMGRERDLSAELRALPPEKRSHILRQVIAEASRVDDEAAQQVLDALSEVGMTIVTIEEHEAARQGAASFRRVAALSDELHEDHL